MNKPMFSLLGYQRPQSNIYATAIIDGIEHEYSATRTKEVLNVYDKVASTGEKYVMASIHKNKPATMLEEDEPKIQVGGVWKDYSHIVGVNVKEDSVLPLLEDLGFEIKRNKPNVVKVKGLKYNVLSDVKVTYDVTTNGNSVENFLYNPNILSDLIEEKQLDMSWLKKKNYRILTATEDIMEWLDGLDKTEEIVGFDTETSGLLVNSSRKDVIAGICMSYEDNAGVYFPLNHIRMDNVEMGMSEFIKLLKPYVDKRSKKRKKLVTHNGVFDWRVMKSLDIYLNIVFDTFLRYSLMKIDDSKNIIGLKPMAKKMLGIDVIELTDMYMKKSPIDVESVKEAVFEQGLPVNSVTKYKLERANGWEDLQYDFRYAPYDFVEVYGSADADFPRLIHKMLDKDWDKALDMVYNIEIGVIPAIGEQEYYGVKAIEEEFVRLNEQTLKKLDILEKDIYSLVGRKFDVSSPKQKSKVLFEDLQCPKLDRFKTETGSYGTGKDVLETLGGYKNKDGSPMYPIVDLFSKHTKLSKLVSSFYGKLPQLIHDGHLYPSYMSMGAKTGRFSCSKPNLQQTEPTSRNYMVCDSDEYYFMICDYSQVEYRIMAGLSQEKKVIDFFSNNPEADYHIMAVSNMMNIPYEDVTPKQRKMGKKLNFGTTYGLGDENLALNLYGNTTELHQQMARQAREQYFAGVPILRDYFEKKRDEAQDKGYAETLFGRRRPILEFQEKNPARWKIAGGRRKAGNMPVQGTAADLQKMALTRIYNSFKRRGHFEDEARIVMNIHDEVVVQVHKSLNPYYALMIIREAMEMDMSKYGFPPLYIGGNVGYSWRDGKEDKLESPVLLMDRKVKEIKEKLDSGVSWKDLETYDDPRAMWLEDIRKFSLEEVAREMEEKSLDSIDKFHIEKRALKYAMVYNHEVEINGKKSELKYENNIYNHILEKGWEGTYSDIDEILKESPIKYTEPPKSGGIEVPESTEELKAFIRKRIRYNSKEKKILVKLLENDSDFIRNLDSMLVPTGNVDYFKTDNVALKVFIQFGEKDIPIEIKYKRLLSGFIPLLLDMIQLHVTGGNYSDIEDNILVVGDTLTV